MSDTKPIVSAFGWVPDFAKGRVRDLRVRWALEEVGQPYDTHLLNAAQPRGPDYVCWHPFDQVPAWRDSEVEMFESGAILLRVAETHGQLLPQDEQARWQAISWLFAALNSVEPILARPMLIKLLHADEEWVDDASEKAKPLARKRLQRLADALGEKDWLAGEFSIADICMITAFSVDGAALIDEYPNLAAYRERGRSRPAFQRALDAQLADFTAEPAT